jgi:integrase
VCRVLDAAEAEGPQWGALLAFMFDSGARISEVVGLQWADLDLATGRCTIQRQMTAPAKIRGRYVPPEFCVTKTGRARVIALAEQTVRLLIAHRKAQAILRIANAVRYQQFDAVFVSAPPYALVVVPLIQEYARRTSSSWPASARTGRHTSATSMLASGEAVSTVQQHLGHASAMTTLDFYSHVLPAHQSDAAARRGERLYGAKR